jgi:predicted site-specific integrase-resolvase
MDTDTIHHRADPYPSDSCTFCESRHLYRVTATENKDNLDGQPIRLRAYCTAKGYPVTWVVNEIGSGVNDTHPKLMKLLTDPSVSVIVVEHKDRLTRFVATTT